MFVNMIILMGIKINAHNTQHFILNFKCFLFLNQHIFIIYILGILYAIIEFKWNCVVFMVS